MMKRYRLFGFIGCLFLAVCTGSVKAQPQDGWGTLEKICSAYSGKIAFRGRMRLYPEKDSSHTIEEMPASFILFGTEWQDNTIGNIENIRTPQYDLTVNYQYKTIFIARSKDIQDKTMPFDFASLKKLWQAQNVQITSDTSGSERSLQIAFKGDPQVKSYQLYYSRDTYLLNYIYIRLWDSEDPGNEEKVKVLAIHYSGYRAPETNEKDCSEKKFLTVQGNRIIPKEKYRNYQIISQLFTQ